MVAFFRVKLFNLPEDEINFDSFIEFPLAVFKILLFDFETINDNASFKTRFSHYAKTCFTMFAVLNLLTATFQFATFAVFHSDDFAVTASAASYVSTLVLVSVKVSILFLRKNDIRRIFDELRELSASRVDENSKYRVKRYLDGYLTIAKVFSAVSLSAYLMVFFPPLLSYVLFGIMKPALNFWFPFDVFHLKTFPITLFWADLTAYNSSTYLLAIELTLYGMITVISMEFDVLKADLMELRNDSKSVKTEKISALIHRHNRLLKLSEKLQEIYGPTFLVSFVISSIIICFVLFQVSTTKADSAVYTHLVPYLVTIIIQIWLLCMFGQKLMDSSVGVAKGIYESDWINWETNESKKEMILVMIRAQRPQQLTALKFAGVSLESFKSVRFSFYFYSIPT